MTGSIKRMIEQLKDFNAVVVRSIAYGGLNSLQGLVNISQRMIGAGVQGFGLAR